jgi:hypothetical protein
MRNFFREAIGVLGAKRTFDDSVVRRSAITAGSSNSAGESDAARNRHWNCSRDPRFPISHSSEGEGNAIDPVLLELIKRRPSPGIPALIVLWL